MRWLYYEDCCLIVLQILRDLGVRTMKLMTNNPANYSGLKGYGLAVAGKVPLVAKNNLDVGQTDTGESLVEPDA